MDWTANPSTGKKRPLGDDELQSEQPLSKKLAMLSLHLEEKNRSHRGTYTTTQSRPEYPESQAKHFNAEQQRKAAQAQDEDERMEVDNDNPDVVFIHNLDDELSSDDENDKGIVFLPDIEKKLTRVPYDLARGGGSAPQLSSGTSTALVLYTVPSSLTVSKEQDGVRRAIIEARARIRQKQADGARLQGPRDDTNSDGGFDSGLGESDPDAMDIE